jgi:hypothetical protein
MVDGDFTIAQLVAKPRRIYPLESDSSVYVLEEDYMVFIDYYEPLTPTTPHPDLPNLYFVKDSQIQDVGNGIGRFTRTWAVLPGYNEDGKKVSYINQTYESYGLRVPGITTAQGLFLVNFVSSYYVANGQHVITTTTAHDVEEGKSCAIGYWVKDPVNNFSFWRNAIRMTLPGTSPAGAVVVVKEIRDINAIQPTSVMRAASNAEPYTKVVASRLDTDFWLPGVNVNTADDIPIVQNFEIIDNQTGNRTEYLSETTNPTVDEFRQWVEDGRWIAAESSVLRRWQGSEILARTTRYVKATL